MEFKKIMNAIESTEKIQVLQDLLNVIEDTNLSIRQKQIATCFAQLRIGYATIKFNERDDSPERDALARALDVLRDYEHGL